MSLSKLTANELRQALRLLEQRAALLQQIAQVENQLSALEGSQATTAPAAAAKAAPSAVLKSATSTKSARATAGGRRRLKEEVVELLQAAGPTGLSVREVADRLGVDVNRIFTWFYATGKKIGQIKKLENARYRWVA